MKKPFRNDPIRISINGHEYDSINQASSKIGVSQSVLTRAVQKLRKSKLSEMEHDFLVRTTFTLKKIKGN